MGQQTHAERYFVTVGKNPFGAKFPKDKESCIQLARQAKAEFPNSDVVAWCKPESEEPFEIWENGNCGSLP